MFSFLLLEEGAHELELPEDVVGFVLEMLDVAVEVVGLEDSQIVDVHSFRLLDLLVFNPKSASVIETSRP